MSTIVYNLMLIGALAMATAWLWLLKNKAEEAGNWPNVAWYLKSLAIGTGIMAVAIALSLGKGGNSLSEVGLGVFLFSFCVNLSRVIWRKLREKFGGGRDDNHMRGAALVDGDVVIKQIRRSKVATRLEIGGVPIPVELETRSFLLAGSPGSGKSQAMTVILDEVRASSDRAIIADASGQFYSRYGGGSGDVLLNPFDQRSARWSPLAEIRHVADCASLTKSMIPDGIGSAAEWNGYAQSVLQPMLEHLAENGGTNGELFRLTCIAELGELREILNGTAAAPLVAEGNERMFGSVRAILSSYLKAYQYLDPAAGADGFSIRNYVDSGTGWLFLTYQQDQRDALKPLLQAALDVASRAVLSLPVQLDRRVFFGLDEFPLLGNVNSIIDLLTNGRKHGAVALVGIQAISQLRETYGKEKTQTILSTLGTWLTLRVADHETADYMSKALGDEEVRRVVASGGESSSGAFQKNKSTNWQEQVATQKVVLPSELQTLPDLCGYLNIAGPLPICPVRLPLAEQRAPAAAAFEAAPARARTKLVAPAAAVFEAAQVGSETPFDL